MIGERQGRKICQLVVCVLVRVAFISQPAQTQKDCFFFFAQCLEQLCLGNNWSFLAFEMRSPSFSQATGFNDTALVLQHRSMIGTYSIQSTEINLRIPILLLAEDHSDRKATSFGKSSNAPKQNELTPCLAQLSCPALALNRAGMIVEF